MKSAKPFIIISCTILILMSVLVYASKDPVMQLVITDTNQVFQISVINHEIKASYGQAADPDLIIKMSSKTFSDIFNAEDMRKEARVQFSNGKITIESKKEISYLVLKGYKSLYDIFSE